jgi:hypothetical protein
MYQKLALISVVTGGTARGSTRAGIARYRPSRPDAVIHPGVESKLDRAQNGWSGVAAIQRAAQTSDSRFIVFVTRRQRFRWVNT